MQGDIGVARSTDKGATWQQLGIALDEDWHLSYPYVFDYNGNVRPLLLSIISSSKLWPSRRMRRERSKGGK